MADQAQPQAQLPDAAQATVAAVPVISAASMDPGRDRQFLYQQFNALGPFSGNKGKSWYKWERKFSQIIENFTEEQKINIFRVILCGVSRGQYQRALEANQFIPKGSLKEYQHAVMLMNSLYIDEDQKIMRMRNSCRSSSFLMILFLLKLIVSKLNSFKLRILVYLRMILSVKIPSLMVFLCRFTIK
jgi:hypothetical protein